MASSSGNQAAHTKSGRWNQDDQIYLFLYACAFLRAVPDVDWKVELTPVSFTSWFIVNVACKLFTTNVGKVFNIINEKLISLRDLATWMQDFGYSIETVSLEKWLSMLQACSLTKNGTGEADNFKVISKAIRVLHRAARYNKQTTRHAVKQRFKVTKWPNGVVPGETVVGLDQATTFVHPNVDIVLQELQSVYPSYSQDSFRLQIGKLVSLGLMPPPDKAKPLNGKVCFVTGASSGIGEAIARKLGKDGGAKIVLAGRRMERLETIKNDLSSDGVESLPLRCDVTNLAEVRKCVDEIRDKYGKVDILVNNAGVMYATLMQNCLIDQWKQQVDVNCQGTLNVVGSVLPGMVERKSGHIVTITSDAGKQAFPGLAVYSGTKFFLEGMLSALRNETKAMNIKVTNVQPGYVKTELYGLSTDPEALKLYEDDMKEEFLEAVDIAEAVYFAVTQPSRCAVNEILVEPKTTPI